MKLLFLGASWLSVAMLIADPLAAHAQHHHGGDAAFEHEDTSDDLLSPQHADIPYVLEHDPWPLLMEALRDGLEEHPALVAQHAMSNTTRRGVDGVGIKPDPSVHVAAMSIPWHPPSLRADAMSAIELGVSVPLWWPKELKAQKRAVQVQSDVQEAQVDALMLVMAEEATEIFYDIYAIDRQREALEGIVPLLREDIQLMTMHVSGGHVSIAQVERARLEYMQLREQLDALADERRALVIRFNTLLGRDVTHTMPPLHEVSAASEPREIPYGDDTQQQIEAMVTEAMEHRPTVRVLEQERRSADAQADAAVWQKKPQFEVFGSWLFRATPHDTTMMGDGTDMFNVGLRSTLPIASRKRANNAMDVAQAQQVEVDAKIHAFERQVRGEIAEHLSSMNRSAARASVYKNVLIPQAQRVHAAAISGIDTGQGKVLDWFYAEQQLRELHVQYAAFDADILKHAALLQLLTHNVFPDILPP